MKCNGISSIQTIRGKSYEIMLDAFIETIGLLQGNKKLQL